MNIRSFRILTLIVIFAMFFSACAPTSVAAEKPPLRVGWSLWPGWYPLLIAQELGLYEKNGANIELVYYDLYKDIQPALASGMLDGGGLALGDVLLDDVAEDVQVVLITDASNGADQILAAPGILGPKDLRGKRIGFQPGTYAEVLVQAMLDANGISRSDVTFVEVPVEDIPNAIPDTIDAGHTYEPYASQARANGFNPIFTSADTPGLLLDVYAFRSDVLADRPEDVRGFIAAWFEALRYWQNYPTEGDAIIAKVLNIPESEVTTEGIRIYNLADNQKAFEQTGDVTSIFYPARIDLQLLSDRGIISYPITIDANFLNPSFLQ